MNDDEKNKGGRVGLSVAVVLRLLVLSVFFSSSVRESRNERKTEKQAAQLYTFFF